MQGPKEDEPGPWLTIVGVSPTIRQGEVQALEPAAVLYKPSRMAASLGTAMIVRTAGDPASMIGAVREAAKALDPDQPLFDVRTLDEVLARNRVAIRVFGTIFVILAVLALVLSSVGIYAITSYSVTQRTQELGLRLALGAQASQISWLILRTGLCAAGHRPGARPRRRLRGQPGPQVAGRADPGRRSGHIHRHHALLTIVMLTACLIPARRATRMDPLAALREE